MNSRSKLIHFIDIELPEQLCDLVTNCFDLDLDPEVSWSEFRKKVKHIKKYHHELYLNYGEEDSITEAPESDIAKFRQQNND